MHSILKVTLGITISHIFFSSIVTPAFSESQLRPIDTSTIKAALSAQNLTVSDTQASSIQSEWLSAHLEHCASLPKGNSKVTFSSVQIALRLGLNPKIDPSVVDKVKSSITSTTCPPNLGCDTGSQRVGEQCVVVTPTSTALDWNTYFDSTLKLNTNSNFMSLLTEKKFFPVKISWEDIGRYEGSVWGDRISDVGVWVRRDEHDPASAELALSVRRDSNFRDKVLMVPAEKIKIHSKDGDTLKEVSLSERLKALGLTSKDHDTNVIVSNQFSLVPVAQANKARTAFTFSIFPYGSTNFVITDVIEGSSDAVVGPGNHQLLFANIDGKKAPFTASRASERTDLVELESKLKSEGMDVDVQRYYLIQIPLKKEAPGIQLSNMGTPPFKMPEMMPMSMADGSAFEEEAPTLRRKSGVEKVAIGHGDAEGVYSTGSGFAGNRAEEPIRVTTIYFVTPVGEITEADMQSFSKTFEKWDDSALWGGSFVVKN